MDEPLTTLEDVLAALRRVPERHYDLKTGFLSLRNVRWDSGTGWPGDGVLEGAFLSTYDRPSSFVAECDSRAGELRYRVRVVDLWNVRTRYGRVRRAASGYDVEPESG